jgi:hypothetical protein
MPPMPAPQPDRCGGDCWKLDGGAGLGRLGLVGEELGEEGAE